MGAIPIRIETVLTNKNLGFINDVDLRNDLLSRLDELDRVVLANAHYSTVFLAIGIVEGVFRHITDVFSKEIRSSKSYPRTKKTNRLKRLGELTLEQLYHELRLLGIAPGMPDYESLYEMFRHYRNCVHPQVRVKKGWEVDLGQAQMALGLLNATLRNLNENVFAGKHVFERVAGSPNYDSDGVLHLPMNGTPHRSFVVLREPVLNKLEITFDLHLSPDSLLNFVFNYVDESDFMMVRLDSRARATYRNSVLRSSQKYSWRPILWAEQAYPPAKDRFPVRIFINFGKGIFDFEVDGTAYTFRDRVNAIHPLFGKLRRGFRVGFFNEVGPVKLMDMNIGPA